MLWSFKNVLRNNLALLKLMGLIGLMKRLSLIGIDAIWRLRLVCLLMRTIASLNALLIFKNELTAY